MEWEKVADKMDIDPEFMQVAAGEDVVTYSQQEGFGVRQ